MGVNNMTYNIKVDNRGLSTERGSKSGSYNLDKISRGFLCEHLGQKYKMKAHVKRHHRRQQYSKARLIDCELQ